MNTSFRKGFFAACAENGMAPSDVIREIESRTQLEKKAIFGSFLSFLGAMGAGKAISEGGKATTSVAGTLADLLTFGIPLGVGAGAGIGGAHLLSSVMNRGKGKKADRLVEEYKKEQLLNELRHNNLRLRRKLAK